MEDESTPQEDSATGTVTHMSLLAADSSQAKDDGISGSGGSAPKDVNEDTGDAPETSNAPATLSVSDNSTSSAN